MERNFILGAVVVSVVALAAATALRHGDVSDTDPKVERRSPTIEFQVAATTDTIERQPSSPIDERRDDALLAHVEHKYRYLLADVESAHVEELKRRLLEREGEANIARRASTDVRVSELLSPRELSYYRALKDSDLEQHHVTEYVGGIDNVAPLDERQKREVLDAKLRQRQRYAEAIRDLGIDRDSLSETEREYAHTHVAEALQRYLNEFLMEVSPSLTLEQYTLLRNYETTEIKRELEKLQQRINAK